MLCPFRFNNSQFDLIHLAGTYRIRVFILCRPQRTAASALHLQMEAPLARPPDGDIDRGTTWIILLAIFGFIAITTTIIRLYVRTLNRQLGWDDFFIGLAAITLLVQITFNGLSYHSGNGHHGYYLSKSQVQGAEKWNYVSQFLLFLVICVTKISICLFVLRIKKTGWLKRFLYALIAGLVLTTLPCEIILFAQCRPLHAFWDRKSGTCWNPKAYNNAIWVQVGMYMARTEQQVILIYSQPTRSSQI